MSEHGGVGGIDVSKAQLDIVSRPSGERWQVRNDPAGCSSLVDRLLGLKPSLIVLEATGGFSSPSPRERERFDPLASGGGERERVRGSVGRGTRARA